MVQLRKHLTLSFFIAMVLAVGCSKEAQFTRYRERANKDFANGDYARAEVEYLNLLRAHPVDSVAVRQLGYVYYDQGRVSQAIPFLIKAHELEPANFETSYKLGVLYLSASKWNDAEQLALQMLDKQPTSENAWMLLADTANAPEKIQTLRQRLKTFQSANPDLPVCHLVLGTLALRQHDVTTAATELQKAVSLQPTNTAAHLALANIYVIRNDVANAEKSFKIAADNSPWRSSMRLKYADFKVQHGSIEQGKAMLNEIISHAPDYIPAWTALMNLAYNSNNLDECAGLVQKVLTRDPMNFEALVTDGRVKFYKGDIDHAIAALQKANNIYERVPVILHNLGLAYLYKGDTGNAVQNFSAAIAVDPGYAPSVLALQEMNIAKGDYIPAMAALNQLIQRRPDMLQPYMLLAQAQIQQKNYDEAAGIYRRLIELFPKAPEPYHLLGAVLAVQKKNAEARQQFEKALQVAPGYVASLKQLVELDIAEQNYNGALERLKQYADPKRPSPFVYMFMARVHSAEKDTAAAEKDLLKAIELTPENNQPYIMLADLYVSAHKQQEALDRLNGFVAKTNDVTALMQIGMIQQSMTNYAGARDTYERLLTVRPKFSPALNNLAYIYTENLVDLDKAQTMAETAREIRRDDPATADTLGWIYYKRGDYARARALLSEAAEKLPDESEVRYHLGLTHYMLGEESAAREALENVVQSKVRATIKQDAQARLAAIDGVDASGKPLSREGLEKLFAEHPDDPIVLTHLANAFDREGATDKAIDLYQRALKTNRKNTQALLKLADYYAHKGNNAAQALELAKEAHNLAPYDVRINRLLGKLAYDAGDYTWSVSLLEQASRSLPNDGDLYHDLAWSYYNVGKLPEAETAMRTALQNNTAAKDDANRFIALIEAYNNPARNASVEASDSQYVPALMVEASRQPEKAKAIYEQVIAKNPLFVPASRDLAVLLTHENSDDAKAYALATKAREAFPDDADVARALGILSYRKGEHRRCIELLKEAEQKRAEDGELYFYLGMAYYNLKQTPDSKAALQRALQWKVDPKLSDQATKVLAELK